MKPRTAAGYDQTHVAHVRATCLYVATKLGDLMDDVHPGRKWPHRNGRPRHWPGLAVFDDKKYLEEDFASVDHETEADAWGVVQDLLAAVRKSSG